MYYKYTYHLIWIFYESLCYLLTYVCTYVQVIFEGSHPTLKLIKQKMYETIHVNIPVFYFAKIQKNDKVRAKKLIFGPKNLNKSLRK